MYKRIYKVELFEPLDDQENIENENSEISNSEKKDDLADLVNKKYHDFPVLLI